MHIFVCLSVTVTDLWKIVQQILASVRINNMDVMQLFVLKTLSSTQSLPAVATIALVDARNYF